MKLRFLIASPAYTHQSGGPMALHGLCDMLNRQGFEAAIVFFGRDGPSSWKFVCSDLETLYRSDYKRTQIPLNNPGEAIHNFLSNGAVIYPEVITDNPLGAKRVIRYILAHTDNFQQPHPNEYILSFSKSYFRNANWFLHKELTDENFHSDNSTHWSDRTLDLTYFGKGPAFVNCFRIPDTIILPRHWPEDKVQLGILLRQCRYFFTWDSVSQTNCDALLCGAVPIFLHERQQTKKVIDQSEYGRFPSAALSSFDNKESVIGHPEEIDAAMLEVRRKIAWYKDTWPDRVREFAVDVSHYFGFVV